MLPVLVQKIQAGAVITAAHTSAHHVPMLRLVTYVIYSIFGHGHRHETSVILRVMILIWTMKIPTRAVSLRPGHARSPSVLSVAVLKENVKLKLVGHQKRLSFHNEQK